MEERMLMAIGAGPDLEEVVPNDGAPLVNGEVRNVSPREITLRFDSTQVINPATLGGIQISRSGGDGFFAPGLVSGTVVTSTGANVFAGNAALSSVDDFYNGKPLTLTSSGQTVTVVDYIGASRTFVVNPALAPAAIAGDTFQVNLNTTPDVGITPAFIAVGDRRNEVVLRFADRLPDDFYRIHIVGAGAGALTNATPLPFNNGADLDFDFRLDLGTQVAAIVPQPVFRSGGTLTYANPDGGDGRNQIEVYFDQNALTAGAGLGGVQNPAYYQLIFTAKTATTADDAVLAPASVQYFPERAMALLTFNAGDLGVLDAGSTVGTYRLRIGNATAPLPAPLPLIVPGADPGSSFTTAHDLGALGAAAQIVAGQTDVQPYGLTLPGSDTDPGHREVPGLSHLTRGADSIDGLTTVYYDFRQDYGVDPTGGALTNQISPQQRARVREAFDLYGNYLGVQFVETNPALNAASVAGSITIASGLLSAIDPTLASGVGGATAVAGLPNRPVIAGNPVPVFSSQLIVMDNADFIGAAINDFGQAYFRGVMRQIGVLLGFGSASDLPDLTVNAPNPSLFGNTGEAIYPGDADILHGQHLYRPESNDIDLYRFTVAAGQHGVFTAETVAERLANSSSLDTVLSFYGDVTILKLPRGLDLQDGYNFTLSDGLNPPVTFEFNSQGSVTTGRRAINFLATDTPDQIAAKVGEAIAETPRLDIDPVVEGDQIRLLGASSVNILNAPFVSQSSRLELLARNDDYYSEDSYLELRLRPGTYYVGLTSTGNTQFDPSMENSGFGGTTQGAYELRLQFRPDPTNNLVDTSGVPLDGDGDGLPGGEFNFWFQPTTAGNTIYVDKTASNVGQLGTLTNPFNSIQAAISAAQGSAGRDIIRIVANGGIDGDVTTVGDNAAYEVGFNASNGALSDGTTFAIPQGTTVMMDPGVIVKLRQANIEIGSTSIAVAGDRSESHLQVLGAPGRDVFFTSYHNEAIGQDLHPPITNSGSGDWGGLVFRNDVDLQVPGRAVLENAGVFLNFVNHANISFGGGELLVSGNPQRFNPLELVASRPTITNNTITASAAAAIAADPNSFADTKFQGLLFTADYERIGPEIHGNRTTGNTFNGLFVRVQGDTERTLDVPARFDDTDIVHILTSNLAIRGNPGGALDPDGPGGLPAQARLDARLAIDPGVILKLRGGRIETQFGAQLLAEGTTENPVLFIGLSDDSYGAGGTFDTNNNGAATTATAGEWGGLYFGYLSHGSIDHARITHGGGEGTIEGGFANFNVVEVHRANVRIAHSTFDTNADGLAVGDRNGRGTNFTATVMVRGAQPQIINNIFQNNGAAVINLDVNSLNDRLLPDSGRSTGHLSRFDVLANNYGPLVRFNRVGNNALNGMEVRGGVLTTGSVWDDTDIVHVVRTEISTSNVHTGAGVRLQSSVDESLVIKLQGATAGFTATGRPLDINDRLGGAVQVVGTPGHAVIFTALSDLSVGAGLEPDGSPQTDTLNVGTGSGTTLPPVPAGNSGAVVIDGGDRDDHGFAQAGPDNLLGTVDDINRDGWQFIQQMLQFALAGARNGAPVSILALTPAPGTGFVPTATQAIVSTARSLGAPVTFVTGAAISTINFNNFQVLYVPSDSSNVFGGITNADLALLTARRTDVQNFVNSGGSLVALTEANAQFPYSWLELPLPFTINDSLFSSRPLRKTPAAIAAGFTITDAELSNGVPYHNSFTGPPGFNSLVPFVFDTGFDNIVGNADDQIITLGLASGSFGIGNTQPNLAGEWRSLQLQQFSNDRNVEASVERESITHTSTPANNTPDKATFLGELAPDELSGDDNRRLGFQVHGYIDSADVDVFSFNARAGTEVWIDLDRTTPGLDTVVELTDSFGNVLARSNDSVSGHAGSDVYDANGFVINAGPGNLGRRLQRGSFSGPDLYTTNIRDAGMRVVLPFLNGLTDRYFVRVRSNSADLSILDNGRSTGSYDLQIRLREADEFPGSTVQFSDIRNATNGIEILGVPKHSPLVGDTGENPSEVNETLATALNIGNLLATDRGSLSIAGAIAASGDVDWYSFTLNHDLVVPVAGDRTWATLFDIDYADGLSRPDTVLSVFDSTGRLIYLGRDSDVTDDRSGTGGTASALDGGSYGTLDALLGTIQLPAGQVGGTSRSYFVAVHSNGTLPTALNAAFTTAPGAANELVRLEPIGSVRRVVEDHIGFTGYTTGVTTTATGQITPETPAILNIGSALSLQTHVRPFDLSDVTLFVSTGVQLSTVDPSTGAVETTVGALGTAANPVEDIVIRSDGQMFGYQSLALTGATAGRLNRIDTGVGGLALIGNDNIPNATLNTDRVDALAYSRTGVANYDLYYSVRDGGGVSRLFRGNPTNGSAAAVAPFGPVGQLRNVDPFGSAIGIVSGMAFGSGNLAGTLFGVSDQGHVFTIETTTGAASILTSIPGVQLQGLGLGPQNLDFNGDGLGGDLAKTLFAIDSTGRLYALEITVGAGGVLSMAPRAVFDADNDGMLEFAADTGIANATGLAFSPLDFNLWHPTFQRGAAADPGHGVNTAPDNSRLDPQNVARTVNGRPQSEQLGGASFYFGLEQFVADPVAAGRYLTYANGDIGAAVNAQYGIVSSATHQDLTTVAGVPDTYNLAGGAYGSLLTDGFSLEGYSATDKPTLYFNYYLRTEGANNNTTLMRDSARVFVSADGGVTWSMVATNNSVRAATGELPAFYSASSNIDSTPTRDPRQGVQELFETTDATREWRQARIDLGDFAGQGNLRLRFDFSTAGTMNEAGLPGDQFGDFGSNARGQANSNEGFFIDDILVGFAERGEMATGLTAANSAFTALAANPNAAAPQPTLTGQYQLEIRRGTEFAASVSAASSAILVNPGAVRDTNDRFTQDFSLVLPAGVAMTDGNTVTVSDGLTTVVFEFNNDAFFANTPVAFTTAMTAPQLVAALRDAINNHATLNVTARSTATSDRLDLVGAVDVTLAGVQRDVIVTFGAATVSEAGGIGALLGTVTRTGLLTGDLVVTLTTSDASEAQVPVTVTIPNGLASANFLLNAVDDAVADGVQSVVITPMVAGYNSVVAALDVTDDDVAELTVGIVGDLSENPSSLMGTVTRNAPTLTDLIVQLFSFDTSEAIVESSVTIMAGLTSAMFRIDSVNDLIADGLQTVTIAALATGFRSGVAMLNVNDDGDTIAANVPIWTAEGPSPNTIGQVEGIPDGGQIAGAIHTVLAHPTDANILYAGAVNGGIWRTTNALDAGGPTWVPLTDQLPSLSIGALEFDITDPTQQTLIAGVGSFSSFGVGGQLTGLLRSIDGGDTWTSISPAILNGQNISGVAARGATILASSYIPFAGVNTGGLFRSTDGGATFTLVSGTSGLPVNAVSDLVADPSNPSRFYAAVLGVGLFRTDNLGATWVNISPAGVAFTANNNNTEFAVHSNPGAGTNAVYVGIMNNGQLANLLRSTNFGATWTALALPTTNEGGVPVGLQPNPNPGGQGAIHFSIVADPLSATRVYVGGDRQPTNAGNFPNSIGARDFSGRLFRVDASLPLAQQATSLTHVGTASNSAPHADSREMVFNALGQIIESNDGGIYVRTSPGTNQGDWYALHGTLQVTEFHNIAYDANTNTLIGGAQDTGTPEQVTPDGLRWRSVSTADGGDVAVDDSVPGQSIRYSSFQNLGAFRRRTLDANNNVLSTVFPALVVNGTGGQNINQVDNLPFVTQMALNNINPARLVIAAVGSIYESFDRADTLTSLGGGGNAVAMSYGGRRLGIDNPDVLWVAQSGNVLLRTTSGGSLVATAGYPAAGGTQVRDLFVDPDDWMTAYVIDANNQVFSTTNGGSTYTNITGNLSALTSNYQSIVVAPGAGAAPDRLFVGSGDGVFQMLTNAPGVWTEYGALLPNTIASDLDYDARDGILVVGTLGRGAFSTTALGVAGNITVQIIGGPSVFENAGPGAVTARITRDTTQGNLPVVLTSSNTSRAIIAGTATILDGMTSVDVAINLVNNPLVDGTQGVIISVSAAGFDGIAGLFDVLDQPGMPATLTVSVSQPSVAESAGDNAATVTVTRNTATDQPLLVSLTVTDRSEVQLPLTVQIPAGQTSITVFLDAVDDFAADGTQIVRITASAAGHVSGVAVLNVLDDSNVIRFDLTGDDNVLRAQGQVVVQSNRITSSADVGILIDAAARTLNSQPHPGVARNVNVVNTLQLAPGVTVENNVVSFSGDVGIRISGDTTPAGQSIGVTPFVRVVNNTIFGASTAAGIGIEVTDLAATTLLNNIVANVITGVSISLASQPFAVLGGMLYQRAPTTLADTGAANAGLGSFPISLSDTALLFRNSALADFELVQGSLAIDSSINSVPERPELAVIYASLGIANSDVLAPEFDITGRLRGDNPFVNSPIAQGANVFKDRGAIERLDPVRVSVADARIIEANATVTDVAAIRLSEPVNFTLTVNYATAAGTALNNIDYLPTSGVVTFNPGETFVQITISVLGDLLDEFDESFFINLSNLSLGAVIDDGQAEVTIVDDDALPAVFINDVSQSEGDGGTSNFVFTVNLSAPSDKEVSVQFATRDGTALLVDGDYNSTSGPLTFAPGQTTQLVTVQVLGNPFVEPDETFFVDLANPVNATIGRITGVGTILDDEPLISIAGVTVTEGSIGATNAVFTVRLSKVSQTSVVVAFAAGEQLPVSATSGADFTSTPANSSLTFAAGETSRTITVQVVADTIAEPTEQFDVVLSSPLNAKFSVDNLVTQILGTGTILDDEPRISITDVSVNPEGNAGSNNAVFTVLLDRASTVAVTVAYTTTDATATNGPPRSDYTATNGVLTFAPSQTALTVTVQVAGDTLDEIDETFTVDLSAATNSTIVDPQGVGTIVDDDALPFLSIGDLSQLEGNSGTTDFVFTVELTAESGRQVTVAFTTTGATATSGDDFDATSGTLTFAVGQTLQTVTVAVTGDTLGEPDEAFFVDLATPVNASLPGALPLLRATGTIIDDEPRVSISDVTVAEGNSAIFDVTLSHVGAADVIVSFTTGDGTAVEPGDYAAQTNSLTFAVGETSKTITVTTVNDLLDELDETFQVLLSGAPTAVLSDAVGVGTVTDDDLPPTISILDTSVDEGTSGTTNAVFQVVLSGASGRQISVAFATSDGTALDTIDYLGTSGTLTFNPGQVTQTLTVAVRGDTQGETNETFVVTLDTPVNATLADDLGVGTILDDEPRVFIDDVTIQENSVDRNAVFVVRLDRTSSVSVVANFSTADGTAGAPADYTSLIGAVTFAPNETVQLVTVVVRGDTLDEDDETFLVNITAVSNANIGDGQAVGQILDDDLLPVLAILDPAPIVEGNSGQTSAVFTVTLSPASGRSVVVLFNTVDNTATAGLDYASTSGTLTFLPGQTTQRITVQVLGDAVGEQNETFFVNLSSLSAPGVTQATYSDAQGQGIITDDEPRISIGSPSIGEPDAGTVDLLFPVTITGTATGSISVSFATADNTATSGNDFFANSGTLLFVPGQVQQFVTISVQGDLIDEINETFFVDLSGPSANAVIAASRGTGTIVDNDPFSLLNISDASAQEGDAGTTDMVFTVTLSPASGRPVSVGYFTSAGTAATPADFQTTSGTVSFAPGATVQQITVRVVGDLTPEFDESFQVTLNSPSNGTIVDGSGTGLIHDDDARLTIADVTINPETNSSTQNVTFDVRLTRPSTDPITVRFDTAAGTAAADIDYFSTSGTLTFGVGATLQQVTVQVIGDLLDESDETFFINLSQAVSSIILDGQSLATIVDDDALPSLTINSLSLAEGDLATTDAVFTVALSAPSGRDVTVVFATTGITAASPSDFQATTGTLTFLAALNDSVKFITVPVVGDLSVESDETFVVNLAGATNASIAAGTGTGTILDDEPRLSVSDVVVSEGGVAVLPVLLSKPSGGFVTVEFTTASGTATAGADFTPASGTLTFQPGQTVSLLNVSTLADSLDEDNETFVVDFSNAVGASILDNQGQITIADDDSLPGLVVSSTSVTESDSGTVNAVFSVSLNAISGRQVVVSYATAAGSATSGIDFNASSGVLTFIPGQTQQNVTVQVNGDTLAEPDETFVLGLSNPTSAAISVSPGTATIIDNEGRLVVSDVTVFEGNTGATTEAVFNVTLTRPSTGPVTVAFTTNSGAGATGATSGSDFIPALGSLSFAIGQTIQTVTVTVTGDVVDEFDETFTLDLSQAVGAVIEDGRGVGVIANDDSIPVLSIDSVTANEGNPGAAGRAVFNLSLSTATARTVTVRFATTPGTAAAGDFSATTGTLTFQPGQITQNLTVNFVGDTIDENDENFLVTLSNPVSATLGIDTGVGTIRDDDARVFINDLTVAEGDTALNSVFNVTLSKAASANVVVVFSTAGVTALAGSDFAPTTGTLTFTPGQTSLPVTVPILGDFVQETPETFNVNLTIQGSSAQVGDLLAVGTILDNDGVPAINISDAQVTEGNAGTVFAVFNVSLSVASGLPVSVNFATANGTAIAGVDYVATSGTLNFAPGQVEQQISVAVLGDTVGEANETLTVTLSAAVNGVLADAQGLGTIVNDDTQHLLVTGADFGGGPHVKVYNSVTGQEQFGFFAYHPNFIGGVRVASGDINGDGQADIITAAGRGGGPHIKVFDGRNGAEIGGFFAFESNFSKGIYVAAGDVNGDGRADIIVGTEGDTGESISRVRVFNGPNFALIQQFDLNQGSGLSSGARVAAGDIDGDGRADVIMSASVGAQPRVIVRDGLSGNTIANFLAYNPGVQTGVYVAAGDFNGDGRADIITGPGFGVGPHVRVFSGANTNQVLTEFFAYHPNFGGGVRVGATDFNGDGQADIITAAGPTGGPHVKVISGPGLTELTGFFAYHPAFSGGVFVGGSFRTQGAPLQAEAATPSAASTESITLEDAIPMVNRAIADWAAAGLDQTLVDRLRQVEIRVADLPDGYLGMAYPRAIVLDNDAAGRGWFLDSTPWLDEEFDLLAANGLQARRFSAAAAGIDLLTVIAHELGHTLGLEDVPTYYGEGGLMSDALPLGVRRSATGDEVDALFSNDNW